MWLIVEQFPIKPGWRDGPFVLPNFSRGSKQSWTSHHENPDLSSWIFRPFIMKISTVHHENLDRSTWKSRPFIMKISTVQLENLDRSTWKSRPFNIKISTFYHENLDRSTWKSRPFITKVSAARNKISTARNKFSTARHENKLNFWPKWRSIHLYINLLTYIND